MYGRVNYYSYSIPAPAPPSTTDRLAQHLHVWWWTRGQLHFQYSPWFRPGPWPPAIPSHQEQVQAIVAELAQDAELAQLELCTFLGTPEGKVIEAAVEAAIPEPYRLVVQEALTLVCHQRGAGRQALIGVGALGALAVAGLIALLKAE